MNQRPPRSRSSSRRRHHQNKPNSNTPGQQPNTKGGGNNRRRRPSSSHSAPSSNRSPQRPPSLTRQYYQLLDQHLKARKQFFEMYFRVDLHRLRRLEDEYHRTQRELVRFQYQLNDWERQKISAQVDYYPQDNDYSKSHPQEVQEFESRVDFLLDPVNEERLPALFYHTETKQKERPSYQDDVEETTGTWEDYLHHAQAKG